MGPCQFTRQWWLKPHQKYQSISCLTSFVAWIPCILILCYFLGRLNIHSLLDIASCKTANDIHQWCMCPSKFGHHHTQQQFGDKAPVVPSQMSGWEGTSHWHNTPQRPELGCLVSTCFNSFETSLWKLWISYGSAMDQLWISYGSAMDQPQNDLLKGGWLSCSSPQDFDVLRLDSWALFRTRNVLPLYWLVKNGFPSSWILTIPKIVDSTTPYNIYI